MLTNTLPEYVGPTRHIAAFIILFSFLSQQGLFFPVAARLVDALRPLLSGSDSKRDTVPLIEGPTPRQTNGYDCGVYVMAIARALCAWWNNGHDHREGDWFQAVRREVDAHSVKAMRADLLQLINTLIQEKAKANSTSKGDTDPGSLQ